MSHETIPLEVLLDEDGHLSEIGATAIGDGELALVPDHVLEHVDGCATCTERLGEAALLSEAIGRALGATSAEVASPALAPEQPAAAPPAPERVSVRPARRFPVAMVAAALAVAIVGVLPALATSPGWIVAFSRAIPAVLKGAAALAHGLGESRAALVAPCLSALIMTVFALLLVRRLPQVATLERGA